MLRHITPTLHIRRLTFEYDFRIRNLSELDGVWELAGLDGLSFKICMIDDGFCNDDLLRKCVQKGVASFAVTAISHRLHATSDDALLEFCFGLADNGQPSARHLVLGASSVSAEFFKGFNRLHHQRAGEQAVALSFHSISVPAKDVLSAFGIQEGHVAEYAWKTYELDGPTKLQIEVYSSGYDTRVEIQRGPRDAQAPDVSVEERNFCICCQDFKQSTAESDTEPESSDEETEVE